MVIPIVDQNLVLLLNAHYLFNFGHVLVGAHLSNAHHFAVEEREPLM